METCIIVTGNPVDGSEYVGPFPSVAEATEYADRFIGCDYWIAPMDYPAMETSRSLKRQQADYVASSKERARVWIDEIVEALRKCADRLGEMDCGTEFEDARTLLGIVDGLNDAPRT